MALLSSGVLPYRKNTTPASHAEAMPTVTAEQIPGLLFSGRYKQNGSGIGLILPPIQADED